MPMAPQSAAPIQVFYSYSHRDEDLRKELDKHLKILERRSIIAGWHDRMIGAGEEWADKIDEHLESADVILLLISSDFISSDYCYSVEMTRALQRHDAGEARVIPIFLRPVNWKGAPFGKLQALPTDAKPVTSWSSQDEAFTLVSEGIERAVETLVAQRRTVAAMSAEATKTLPSSLIPRPPVIGFVARREDNGRDIVERLKEELAPRKNRLVTLSGAGGIGKTTLAAEAARALEELFGGRIVWTSALGRADFTLSTLLDDIITQLGHTDLRTLTPDVKEAQVLTLVADPPALVVLDNYETIEPNTQKRIEEWSTQAQCSVLFTSRPRPRIGATLNITVAAMSREEAEEFLERLITQTQDAQIFSEVVRQRIYETAEANPFVMQWVVGQIDEAQEPRTVLEEVAQGEGDAAERVFDRSFNLPQLGDDGRAALLALSLFAPSATRPALAEVAGFDADLKRVNEAIKNLRALWLIKAIDENRRFTVEGLTRSLARARLSKDVYDAEFRQRFVAYFLRYVEERTQPTPEDYDALEAEKDNLLSAMDVAFNSGDWISVQSIAGILADPVIGMLGVRGYWDEVIRRGEQALAAAREVENEWSIARFSANIACIRMTRGEYDEARQAYQQALVTFKKLGNDQNVAVVLHQLAIIAQHQGEIEEARRLYNESLEIKKSLGNQSGIANTLHELGRLAQGQGEIEEARRLYNESLEIEKSLGNQSGIAITLHELGRLAQGQGGIKEARRLYNESLEINKSLGNQSGIASTLHQLSRLAEDEGNKADAARLMREALGIFEKLKSPYAEIARRVLKRLEGEAS